MDLKFTAQTPSEIAGDWLIAGVCENAELSTSLTDLDVALGGSLERLRERGDLTGKLGEVTLLPDPRGVSAERICLVGLGEPDALTVARLQRALQTAVRSTTGKEKRSAVVLLPEEGLRCLGVENCAQSVCCAMTVGCSSQAIYRSEPERFPYSNITVCAAQADAEDVQSGMIIGEILGDAVNLARELVNRHPNDIVPETFARQAEELASEWGLDCEVLLPAQLVEEKMHALLGVARGSDHEPRVVVLEYRGADPREPKLGLCGKGVTFDSGGLSIKPSSGMLTMKADMAGAATVMAAMMAISRLGLPVNVVAVMGLVENMISGSAYKLGEVLTARNGVTIEVHNTDAEGRLVLADVLSYTVDLGASKLVDLATLTGACVVALGEEVTGAFANNQAWCDNVLTAARTAGEEVWQLPTFESYAEQLKSDFADVKNVGTRWGGAITAAKFLEKFVEDRPWVHLDIAGPSYVETTKPHCDSGGTGVMVRTLVELATAWGTSL